MESKKRIRTGRLMREIVVYLDQKAERVKQLDKTDPTPYATASELSEQLRACTSSICKALSVLRRHGRVRVYPKKSPERRYRKYGSMILPEITYAEIFSAVKKDIRMTPLAIQ